MVVKCAVHVLEECYNGAIIVMGCVMVELVKLSLYVSSHSALYGRCIRY